MRKLILSGALIYTVTLIAAQTPLNIQGVYTTTRDGANVVWMFIDGYCSQTTYKDNAYVSTFGGPYTYQNGSLNVQIEYNDANADAIGQAETFALTASADGFQEPEGQTWKKETAKNQGLDGLWRITGRKQNDKMSTIQRGDRKTIKLLVDGYFQWIAINPAEKGFYGTGGGHYTFTDGKYNEHILFFSRDDSRVGAHLGFDGELKNGEWHHSGLSSKGDPIYEIWSRDNL